MAETVTATRASDKFIAVRVVVVSGKARAAIVRRVKSGIALADTSGIVAQTVTAARVIPARNQLVARRIAIVASRARPAVRSKVISSVT